MSEWVPKVGLQRHLDLDPQEERTYLAMLYGLCRVCRSPRTAEITESNGIFSMGFACLDHPKEHRC